MDHLLVDTCVWLDIAVDSRLAPLLALLERLSHEKTLVLVVPDLILQELDRNVESVQQRTKKTYEALVRELLDTGHVLPTDADREELRRSLGKVSNALPTYQGELNTRLRRLRTMLTNTAVCAQATTDSMMVGALRRGLAKQAPFTRSKNSCGDALLLEHFDVCGRMLGGGDRCTFITSNKQDFGAADDHRKPHPDIANLFDGTRRRFSINIADELKGFDTAAVTPAVVDAAREAADRSVTICPAGGEHDFDPNGGANLRSKFGGLTWHLFCRKCGRKFDTGESGE